MIFSLSFMSPKNWIKTHRSSLTLSFSIRLKWHVLTHAHIYMHTHTHASNIRTKHIKMQQKRGRVSCVILFVSRMAQLGCSTPLFIWKGRLHHLCTIKGVYVGYTNKQEEKLNITHALNIKSKSSCFLHQNCKIIGSRICLNLSKWRDFEFSLNF